MYICILYGICTFQGPATGYRHQSHGLSHLSFPKALNVAVEIKPASVKLWGCNPNGTHKNEHDQFDFKLPVQNVILLSSNLRFVRVSW